MLSDKELKKMFDVYMEKDIVVIHFHQAIDMSSSKYDNDTTRLTELLLEDFNKQMEKLPKDKNNLFVDMSEIIYPPFVNIGQAKNFNKIAGHDKVNKIGAIYGNRMFKAVSEFIIGMAHKRDKFKMFDNKKQAIKWLNE